MAEPPRGTSRWSQWYQELKKDPVKYAEYLDYGKRYRKDRKTKDPKAYAAFLKKRAKYMRQRRQKQKRTARAA